MKRTLSTFFAIIAIFCLTSCSSDEEDYRITGVYETTHYRDLSTPETVINSKEELKNYILKFCMWFKYGLKARKLQAQGVWSQLAKVLVNDFQR